MIKVDNHDKKVQLHKKIKTITKSRVFLQRSFFSTHVLLARILTALQHGLSAATAAAKNLDERDGDE